MRDLTPPFQFDVSEPVGKAARHVKKRVDGVAVNLPFVSISFKPDDKEVELSEHTDGGLYLILEMMLVGIRQFFTFEEGLRVANPDFPGEPHTRLHRHDLQPYFAALEMLRGHLYRCLAQVAIVANTRIPKISDHMRYEDAWQLATYKQPQLINKENGQPTDSGSGMEHG